jgi:Tol biopolymer transport system component
MKKVLGIGLLVIIVLCAAFVIFNVVGPKTEDDDASVSDETSEPITHTKEKAETTTATGKIVYVKQIGTERHVYVMNADGTGATDLASCGTGECYPSWSPDGTRISFERSIDGVGIYIMNANGSNVQRLSPTPGKDVRSSWSADGKQILFTRVVKQDPNGGIPNTEIDIMNADGTGTKTLLPANNTFNVEARMSPDGKKIVFMSALGGSQQVFTMNADGSNVKKLTDKGIAGDPNWSPDSSRISFGSNREGGGKLNIFTMKADGSDVKQITHFVPPYESGDTSWSPDGTQIVFEWDVDGKGQSDPNARAEVWIVNADGSGQPASTGQPCAAVGCSPRWSPIQ